jgi:hypothetical protein
MRAEIPSSIWVDVGGLNRGVTGGSVPGTWEKIELLGADGGFGVGDWFNLPDEVLITPEGRPFAKKRERPNRHPAVLLARREGPAARLWPRSTSGDPHTRQGIIHDAHPPPPDHPRCPLKLYGWVCNHVRCTVLSRQLDANWTCREPMDSPLWDDLLAEGDQP